MKYLVALDPGKTTGVAACILTDDVQVSGFQAGEMDRQATLDWTWSALESMRELYDDLEIHIVAERFTIGPQTMKMTRQHDALEIIGAVRWMTQRHQASFALQDPGIAKSTCSNATLQKIGFWTPGKAGHANDAARHLVVLLLKDGFYDLLV